MPDQQAAKSSKCCCSAGGPLPQMGPHHTCTQETALASCEATHSLCNSTTDVSCSTQTAPAYITNLLHEQRATRELRSATNNDLYVPPSRSRYGDRTFSVSAPRMWNALPNEMKTISCLVTFKRLLKTLFRVAYAS